MKAQRIRWSYPSGNSGDLVGVFSGPGYPSENGVTEGWGTEHSPVIDDGKAIYVYVTEPSEINGQVIPANALWAGDPRGVYDDVERGRRMYSPTEDAVGMPRWAADWLREHKRWPKYAPPPPPPAASPPELTVVRARVNLQEGDMRRLPRIYMAGKIAKNDWRHELVDGLRNIDLVTKPVNGTPVVCPVAPIERDGWEYVGPFFLGDDHGCFHGAHTHGFGALHWPHCGPGNMEPEQIEQALNRDDRRQTWARTRELVQWSCLAQIRSSDAVFARVEQWDAYATLLEIGYATALGIPVYLSLDLMYQPTSVDDAPMSAWNDWWFAEQTASWCSYDASVGDAWGDFLKAWRLRGWLGKDREEAPTRRLWFVETR